MKKAFLILVAVIGFGICLTSCSKEPGGSGDDPEDNPGSNYGTTIVDFPASFAKKLFENWDCSQWLKLYYSAQGFVGIEQMHCMMTADCESEIYINSIYENLYEKGYALLSSSSYNQNTKCVTINFAERSGSGWSYFVYRFYTIDVIK
jgi:hypothetical protein